MSTELITIIGTGTLGAFAFIFTWIMAINKKVDSKTNHKTVNEIVDKAIEPIKETTDRIELNFKEFVKESKPYHKQIDEMHGMLNGRESKRTKP